jgi:hypothetical protein
LRYFANCGPVRGPALYGQLPGAIGVLEALDNHMPIGMALGQGPDDFGVAMWRLSVHGAEVPGLWIILDREFRLAP